jgi:hypothetical protein
LGSALRAQDPGRASARPKVALIHATDLFRPHADPDDHFDLASVFALAAGGFELLAVMIDHPPEGMAADPRSRDRFLFHVRDQERYPTAMTAALGTLLGSLT